MSATENDITALSVPSDLCTVCGRYNDEAFHGSCVDWSLNEPPSESCEHCTLGLSPELCTR